MEIKKHRIYSSIFVFVLFFAAPALKAQDQTQENLKEDFLEAESYFLFEEFKDALPLYQKILRSEPDNDNVNYKIGICYLNDLYQKEKAIPYLEKAVNNISFSFKENSFKEKQAPPEAYFYLGNAYRVNNQISKAISVYKKFKEIVNPEIYDIQLVDSYIKACEVALDVQSRPLYIVKTNLGEDINSRFAEVNPIVSGDESTLVFTKKLQFYDAVFYSKKENGKWSYPINLTPSFGMDGNSYCTGLSWNGDEIYIYRSDNFDGNIYVSHRKAETWSKLEKLNDNINTKYWESHASLSPDGKTIYFTSNRKGGFGGLDIYASKRKSKDNWEPAVNLGPVINSKLNEETPFITGDGKTIYFSSQDHYNMGGYDIFYSTLLDNDKWSKPLNAGYPLNTTGDDLFFVPVKNGEYAYYSMYTEDGNGLNDIYRFEIYSDMHPRKFLLRGMALKGTTAAGIELNDLKVKLIDRKTREVIAESKVNSDGSYTMNVQSGEYDLVVSGKGISDNQEMLTIPVTHPSDEFKHETLVQSSDENLQISDIKKDIPKPLPVITISEDYYEVTDDTPVAIKLDVDKNTELKVEILIDDSLVAVDSFQMNRKKFIYYYRPRPGENLLHFTITDAEGNSDTKTVLVNYPETDEMLAESETVNNKEISDIDYLASIATGNLKKYLQGLSSEENKRSLTEWYNYLLKELPGNDYSLAEVDDLFIRYLSQKDLGQFRNEMNGVSTDKLTHFVNSMNFDSLEIYFSESLVDYLARNTDDQMYTLEDVDYALTRIATRNNNSVSDYIRSIDSYAGKTLEYTLLRLDSKADNFSDPFQITKVLLSNAGNENYSVTDLQEALKKAATNFDVNFLYQSMVFLSDGNLNETLLDLNLYIENIKTSQNLLQYLWVKSTDKGYAVQDVIGLMEQIRNNPRKAVEMFRQTLAQHASGDLKAFIQSIDLDRNNISTFADLLNYLILNSKNQNFNRETVYKLLLDIINPSGTEDFVRKLKRHAGLEIVRALESLNMSQFSSPYELIQYLIGYTDKYSYTEQDILNLLLKLALEKGFTEDESQQAMMLELKKQKQQKMIRSLIMANAFLLVLILWFVFGRKKKDQKNKADRS